MQQKVCSEVHVNVREREDGFGCRNFVQLSERSHNTCGCPLRFPSYFRSARQARSLRTCAELEAAQVKILISQVRSDRQVFLFSATWSDAPEHF